MYRKHSRWSTGKPKQHRVLRVKKPRPRSIRLPERGQRGQVKWVPVTVRCMVTCGTCGTIYAQDIETVARFYVTIKKYGWVQHRKAGWICRDCHGSRSFEVAEADQDLALRKLLLRGIKWSPKRLAAKLGVSPRTIYNMRDRLGMRGLLPTRMQAEWEEHSSKPQATTRT